jgi:hypothetical protein
MPLQKHEHFVGSHHRHFREPPKFLHVRTPRGEVSTSKLSDDERMTDKRFLLDQRNKGGITVPNVMNPD